MKRFLPTIAIVLLMQASAFSFAADEEPTPTPTPDEPGHGPGWGTAPSPPPEHTPLPPPQPHPIPNPQCHDDCPGRMFIGNGVSDYPDKLNSTNELEKTLHNGDFFKEKGYGYDYGKSYGGVASGG